MLNVIPNFDTDTIRKQANLLDRIAGTLHKLDRTLSGADTMNSADARSREERKALDEMNRFMKQLDRLDALQGDRLAYREYGSEEDYARQNQALREIEATYERLQAKFDEGCGEAALGETCAALDDAVTEIKQILHSIGKYDTYVEDARERIIPSV